MAGSLTGAGDPSRKPGCGSAAGIGGVAQRLRQLSLAVTGN